MPIVYNPEEIRKAAREATAQSAREALKSMHHCSMPVEFYAVGTIYECDACGTRWEVRKWKTRYAGSETGPYSIWYRK